MYLTIYAYVLFIPEESRKISKERGTTSRDFLNSGIFATIVPQVFTVNKDSMCTSVKEDLLLNKAMASRPSKTPKLSVYGSVCVS